MGSPRLTCFQESEGIHRSDEAARALQSMRQAVAHVKKDARLLAKSVKTQRHLRKEAKLLDEMTSCLASASESVHLAEASIAEFEIRTREGEGNVNKDSMASVGEKMEGEEDDSLGDCSGDSSFSNPFTSQRSDF